MEEGFLSFVRLIGLGIVISCDYWQPASTCSRPNRFTASGATGHQMGGGGATHPQKLNPTPHTLSNCLNEPNVLLYRTYTGDMYNARSISRVNSARFFLKYTANMVGKS